MATTKVTLSMDDVALSLVQRAAELTNTSVSAVVSRTLNRHLLYDYAPPATEPDPAADAAAARADYELQAAAAAAEAAQQHRAAG